MRAELVVVVFMSMGLATCRPTKKPVWIGERDTVLSNFGSHFAASTPQVVKLVAAIPAYVHRRHLSQDGPPNHRDADPVGRAVRRASAQARAMADHGAVLAILM